MSENNAAGLTAEQIEALQVACEALGRDDKGGPVALGALCVIQDMLSAPAEPTVAPDAVAETLRDVVAHLVGAASAYRTYAKRHSSQGKADTDPFYSTRVADFEKAAERGRAFLATLPTAPHAQPPIAGEPVALPFAILADEMAALRRFDECARDGQDYDVPDAMMDTLSEIGLLRRVRAKVYAHTDFGLSILNGDFDADTPAPQPAQTAPEAQPAVTQAGAAMERDAARWRWCIKEAEAGRVAFEIDGLIYDHKSAPKLIDAGLAALDGAQS